MTTGEFHAIGEWLKETPALPPPDVCPARPPCDCDHGGDYTYPPCGVAFGFACTCDHPCQAHEMEYIVAYAATRIDPECGFEQCIRCHEEV